jgi:polyferredoxin
VSAKFYIKTFNSISLYKHIIWPFVLIISIGGLFYPKLGLIMYPMFLTIMIMGFWAGRFWCGNLCPRGAFFDLPIRKLGKFNRISNFFRNFWIRIIVLTILMSMFIKTLF